MILQPVTSRFTNTTVDILAQKSLKLLARNSYVELINSCSIVPQQTCWPDVLIPLLTSCVTLTSPSTSLCLSFPTSKIG